MGATERTWKTEGLRIVGEATGRRTVRYSLTQVGDGPELLPEEQRELATGIVAALNEHGAHLTNAQRTVYRAAITHHDLHGAGATPAELRVPTGYSQPWIDEVLEQLVVLGLGTRPAKGPVRKSRPFTPSTP